MIDRSWSSAKLFIMQNYTDDAYGDVPLTLFSMGLFRAAHGWGGQKPCPPPSSLKSVTHILQ